MEPLNFSKKCDMKDHVISRFTENSLYMSKCLYDYMKWRQTNGLPSGNLEKTNINT